jgi:FkbM family methyltransferase
MAQGSSDGKHHIATTDGAQHTIDVLATTLDAYWTAQTHCPDLILMDIEGHEGAALQGGQQLLVACKPTLLLEHHGQAETLIEQLASHDYAVTRLDNRHIIAQ